MDSLELFFLLLAVPQALSFPATSPRTRPGTRFVSKSLRSVGLDPLALVRRSDSLSGALTVLASIDKILSPEGH